MNIITVNPYASSELRGRQIAEKLKCSFNQRIVADETVIIIKGIPREDILEKLKFNSIWIDVIDSGSGLDFISKHSEINIIAITERAKEYIKKRCPNNKIIVIPEHHCNWEYELNERVGVKRVGYIGSAGCIDLDLDALGDELKEVGLEFMYFFVDSLNITRQDVKEFYKNIDVQVSFRQDVRHEMHPPELKNALKVYNAGSFKVPTVGLPEMCWEDVDGCYVAANSLEEVVKQCCRLRANKDLYFKLGQSIFNISKDFHIDKIIEEYRKL